VAHITLEGNYTTATFTLSSDGHGGTTVVDPTASAAPAATPARLVQAIATLATGAAHAPQIDTWRAGRVPIITHDDLVKLSRGADR